jgi:hypothetical protein
MNDRPTNTAIEARLRTALSEMIPKLTDPPTTPVATSPRRARGARDVPGRLRVAPSHPPQRGTVVCVAMATAAAVVLTIVGLVVVASRGDDSTPADEPAPAHPLSRHSVASTCRRVV